MLSRELQLKFFELMFQYNKTGESSYYKEAVEVYAAMIRARNEGR